MLSQTNAASTAVATIFQPDVMGSVQGSLRSLSSQEAESLQFVSHDKILTWEGLVENVGKPDARVHLIDTKVFEGHYGYTQKGIGRGAAYTQANFFNEVQSPERRRYMPFLVFDFRNRPLQWKGKSYQWVLNIRRYNYTDTHQGLANMLAGVRTLLSENLMKGFGEPLLFVYTKRGFRRPHVNQLSEVRAEGFDTITEQEMIEEAGGSLVSVLNPGTAIGFLELINADESADNLTPRHIAVLEDTPERVPPVSGIVTLEPQTPLSHVNLLAKNRGTPNISTTRIELVPNLQALLGKLVKMVANRNGTVDFREASLAEAEKFWESRTKAKLEVPTIQATSLLPVEFANAPESDRALPNIGSKASNYATLQQILPTQFVKPGFGLSFAHYQKIVAEPATQASIQSLLSNKGTLSPDEINAKLKEIRDRIRKETSDETVAASLSAVRSVIAKMPTVKRIRLRSSTNSEDLPTFNGAGLYESAGFNVDDSDKKLRKKLLRVMASLWLERAFWERELFGIDHGAVGMAVLMNPAFSDEYANGVVIGSSEQAGFRTWVNAQKGEASVTNPLDDEIPESFTFFDNRIQNLDVQSRSNIDNVFLEENNEAIRTEVITQLSQLKQITSQLYDHFVSKQRDLDDRRKYGIDIEYKLMKEGEKIVLYVKQSRLLNLDHEAARPNDSIRKVVAKDNGMDGGHLRRRPQQLANLRPEEVCVMKTDSVIGINSFETVGNGFVKVNITIPSSSCPDFRGEMYLFRKHFNFI
ncbi:MAG: PEP/pyruvate-binding domain-containing protein [Cyanobacteria bacterium P01_F01_bin.53]